jgi:hypothetical protein
LVLDLDKNELSDGINELLGLKESPIDFAGKLSKEDLTTLHDSVESLALGGLLGKKILNRPMGELMKMPLQDVLKELKEGQGLLGLGLLGRLFSEDRRPLRDRKAR